MGGVLNCVGKNILINKDRKIIAYNLKPLEVEELIKKLK
jgi:hypothetical protein